LIINKKYRLKLNQFFLKMNNLCNAFLFIYVLVLFSVNCFAEEITIQILTERPDFINEKYWKTYSSSIENYLKSNLGQETSNDISISFSYNSDEPSDKTKEKDYENYVKYVVEQLKSSTYDMVILDDKFLFSDNSFVESSYVETLFNVRKINQFYYDMTNDINKNDISFNDPKVLEDGYYDNRLYGLPYELDFDLLYHKNQENLNVDNLDNVSWDDLLHTINSSGKSVISMAYGNDDELLNFFTEYTNSKYHFSGEKEDNFDVFYNDTSKDLFTSFNEFVTTSNSMVITNLVNHTIENAYNEFTNDQSVFFKGKASHYPFLVQGNDNSKTISASLPPKNFSVLVKKYLVINKNSKIDKNILIRVALQLTSKEMQLYKAKQFGSIPTFDISQKDQDSSIGIYFQDYPVIGRYLEKMNRVHIKDIFKSRYAAPFMEIRLLLPQNLKNYLIKKDDQFITDIFENIKNLVMKRSDNKEISLFFLYIPMIIFTAVSCAVMYLVYKYRKHPNLKVFSPHFCNLVIFGYVIDIISTPFFMIQDNSIGKCHYWYVYETVVTELILLPLVAITFRIYSIYHNKSKLVNGNKLDNKHLFVYIIVFMSVMTVIVTCISTFILKFYVKSYGNIDTYRLAECDYDGGYLYENIERIIYTLMVSK